MTQVEIKAPTLPESVPDGTIAAWHKREGDPVSRDEPLVDIETDKVVIEVVSPADGTLSRILKAEGDTITSNTVIGQVDANGAAGRATPSPAAAKPEPSSPSPSQSPSPFMSPSFPRSSKQEKRESSTDPVNSLDSRLRGNDGGGGGGSSDAPASPAAKKLMEEHGLSPASLKGSGKDGRITKEDVLNHLASAASGSATALASVPSLAKAPASGERREERVPMSRLRARVAERLLQATQNTAMLSTFNEVNMAPIMAIRRRHQEAFQKAHGGVRLGFMSFFVRACTEALKRFPAVNASIDGDDIVYHGYQDIGVAVSSPRGLVVPVLRDAQSMGLAHIEQAIRAFGEKAESGKLSIEEMTGGTFTVSNGGVFGSLLSTPILNPPQTAILGMHRIQERPMAVAGEVKILPMMYLALSYDHRLIDGREAVQFLVTVKEMLEEPSQLLAGEDPVRLLLEI